MKQVAIVGCGQLARMLALAGWPLGFRFSFLAEAGEATEAVEGLGTIVERRDGQSPAELFAALGSPEVVTVEKEQVDVALLREIEKLTCVSPGPEIVWRIQDRRRERKLLGGLDIPVAPHRFASSVGELRTAIDELGLPVIVKSAGHGYDGKHQWRLGNGNAVDAFLQQLDGGDWVVEKRIDFRREISFIGARAPDGDMAFYPPAENLHVDGVLRRSIVPAPDLDEALKKEGEAYLGRLLSSLDYVGVLAMECFDVGSGLLVNELAPRVHNSGHWSQQGTPCCQFANHLRAICNLPLGATTLRGHAGMINMLGRTGAPKELLSPRSSSHVYGKSERPGRKLGHVNVVCDSADELTAELQRLAAVLYPEMSGSRA